jgi:serine/threonine protein kinase
MERELLEKMLTRDPAKRISAKQCLDHPYFKVKDVYTTGKFSSDDFNCIESELDVSQQTNIAKYYFKIKITVS